MPASVATSSRRSPGVRRTPETCSPASAGSVSSRRARRYSPSGVDRATRSPYARVAGPCPAEPGPATPRTTGTLPAAVAGAHGGDRPPHRPASGKDVMPLHTLPGGTYRVGDLDLTRVGYGAMQLAGPGVFGPPKDRDAAIAVLRA